MSKITDIEVQKRNKERVNVYVDGEFTFACDAEFVYKEKLKAGMQIDLAKIKEIVIGDEFKKCKSTALRIIERSYKSEKEVYNKLIEKGYEEEVATSSLEFLKEYGYIDDKNYAGMYIRDRLKTEGKNKIKYSLIRKGIDDSIIKEALLENSDEEIEMDIAIKLAKRRYDTLKKSESDKYKLSQKLYRFLVGKGYGFDLVSRVVKKVTNDEFEEEYYES
ncbi:recombination regulator RecX [uncultured Clostridium sp.]|jgi:regulatory protein|uniref:recombination regulator RecX n=1 Tax=uncultured Clostridium sp. TaxID=59620 RepID=UPI0026125FA5|nr:recombination regulator RecX [uncultured Clostridium sp.]